MKVGQSNDAIVKIILNDKVLIVLLIGLMRIVPVKNVEVWNCYELSVDSLILSAFKKVEEILCVMREKMQGLQSVTQVLISS